MTDDIKETESSIAGCYPRAFPWTLGVHGSQPKRTDAGHSTAIRNAESVKHVRSHSLQHFHLAGTSIGVGSRVDTSDFLVRNADSHLTSLLLSESRSLSDGRHPTVAFPSGENFGRGSSPIVGLVPNSRTFADANFEPSDGGFYGLVLFGTGVPIG